MPSFEVYENSCPARGVSYNILTGQVWILLASQEKNWYNFSVLFIPSLRSPTITPISLDKCIDGCMDELMDG